MEQILTIRTSRFEAQDDNAIDLDLNANDIPADLVHLKRWKDPDK